MGHLIEGILGQFGPIEWFFFWVFLLLPPIVVFWSAIDAFLEKETPSGMQFLGAGVVLLALVGLLLINFGKRLVDLTVASLGGWVIGLLIVGAICLVALPISLVGSQLRTAFEYTRRGYWSRGGGKAFFIGMLGVLTISGVAFFIYRSDTTIGLGFGGLAIVALVLGWFGRFLAPEIIETPGIIKTSRRPLESVEESKTGPYSHQ